jgi:hypothetical protein
MRGYHAALAHRADASGGRLVAGGSWSDGQVLPPTSQSVARTASIDRSEATMSKRARALILGATLAAMNLAGMTAVAHAQATDQQATARPPTERQVGESWRHRQAASQQQQTAAETTLKRVLARERFSIPNTSPAEVPAPVPPKQSGQPGRLIAWLGVLVAAVVLAGGLGVLVARRTRRRARLEHAA